MDHIRVCYHMTSIYDHSIFEAFSKVIQKLIRQLSAFESLLDIFNQVFFCNKKRNTTIKKLLFLNPYNSENTLQKFRKKRDKKICDVIF
jgi:3-deoxy-D-manno-octulosonic acid (KDO) 8-phosphate synthase